jgi:cytochrome c
MVGRLFVAISGLSNRLARSALVGATCLLTFGCGRTRTEPVQHGAIARGKEAIANYGCGSCHQISGIAGARGILGPSLDGIAGRRFIAGAVPNSPEALVRWIVMPQSILPGGAMPNLGVSDADARDITAYLYSLH